MNVKKLYGNFFCQVPNPLFDLAGILCGQFNIPFWKFFLATLIGKAIVKVCIQVRQTSWCNSYICILCELLSYYHACFFVNPINNNLQITYVDYIGDYSLQ